MHIYRYSAENHDFFPQIFMKMPKNGKSGYLWPIASGFLKNPFKICELFIEIQLKNK